MPKPATLINDICIALALLTRLPTPAADFSGAQPPARAVWAYPLAGVVLAALASLIAMGGLAIGLPVALVAGLTLASLIISTGALHEDGLADSADGIWGGTDAPRRLEIMKDSRIGAYGVIALIVALGLRWQGYGNLLSTEGARIFWSITAIAITSRAAMIFVMYHLPHARRDGLSKATGRPEAALAYGTIAAVLLGVWLILGASGIWLSIGTAVTTLACAQIARTKINGHTGDILGATQQLSEIAGVLILSALS